MMGVLRRLVYWPPVNRTVRGLLAPFAGVLPVWLKIPVAGVISVETEVGGKVLMDANQTSCLAKEVFWGGVRGYEFPSVRIFMELVRRADCFVDVGASIGYYSLIAARINPSIEVHAFEPMPGPYHYLVRNIQLNDFADRVHPAAVALADDPGEVNFFMTRNPKALHLEHQLGGSSSASTRKDSYSESIKVKADTLDRYLREAGVQKVDIVKMDTEGTEDRVLAGARQVIQRDRPILLCEVLPGRIEAELEAFCTENGYLRYLPEWEGLRPVETLEGHPESKDFILVHGSRTAAIERFLLS